MANDDKTIPPKPRAPTTPPFEEDSEWEREVAAWDPSFSQSTPPPIALGPAEPPPPDSTELVLDDISSGEVVLRRSRRSVPPRSSGQRGPSHPSADAGRVSTTRRSRPWSPLRPGAEPESAYPFDQESSGVLVIPEIAELEAAATAPPTAGPERATLTPSPAPATPPPRPTAPASPRETGRELTEDGLPDVSALFMGSEPAPPHGVAEPPGRGRRFERALHRRAAGGGADPEPGPRIPGAPLSPAAGDRGCRGRLSG